MISKGLTSLLFVVLVVAIVFLMFQINDNSTRCKELKIAGQDRVAKAARLLMQSATQNHPLFAHEHALEAKLILDDVIREHNGITTAEKTLKFPKGKLESLRQQIYEQHSRMVERFPEVDLLGTSGGALSSSEHQTSSGEARKKKRSSRRYDD